MYAYLKREAFVGLAEKSGFCMLQEGKRQFLPERVVLFSGFASLHKASKARKHDEVLRAAQGVVGERAVHNI